MSQLEVDKIVPQSGTTLTIGDSGDTITIPSGATLSGSLNADNLDSGTVPDGRITGAYTGITNLTMSGDLTVNTDTLKVDSTNNRVGIGTSSPDAKFHVTGRVEANGSLYRAIFGAAVQDADMTGATGGNGTEVQIQSASSARPASLTLGGAYSNNQTLGVIGFYNSGNTDGKRLRAFISSGQEGATANEQGASMSFYTASDAASTPTERIRIDSSGNVGIGTISPSQKLDVVGSIEVSDGIYIGGTGTANKLDDYEEGTWTPGVVGFTTSSSQGYYRKIGNQVTVWFTYQSTTNLSTSFAYDITGLPFTPTTYSYPSTGGTFGLLKFVTTTLGRGLTVSLGSYESTKLRASIFNFNGTTADASYDDGLTGMATYFID
jgi:hypothetical protein